MKTCFVALFSLSIATLTAQIEITSNATSGNQISFDAPYTQNFDSLTGTGTILPFVDNETLLGWYATNDGSLILGSGLGQGVYSLGVTGGQGDRSLGARYGAGIGNSKLFAVRFANATSLTLTGLSVSFDGEQWYRSPSITARSSTLRFEYQIFDADQGGAYADSSVGWIPVPSLDFISPNAALTTGAALDGNASENSVRDIQALIDGVSIAPTQEIWLRWVSYGVALGIPVHGQGIDNLSVSFITAIPEPAAFAGLAGLGALGFALSRRRSRLG
jgi:hypothetical protein